MSETHEFMERFIRNQREMLNIILSRDKIKEADEEEERHRKIKSMSLIYDYRVPVSPIRKLHAAPETSPPKAKIVRKKSGSASARKVKRTTKSGDAGQGPDHNFLK